MSSEKVCISIVTYNNGEEIKKCVDSLGVLTKESGVDIFILDNSTNDSTFGLLESLKRPNLYIEKSKTNCGFAGGHNYILKKNADKYDYFLLFNPDAYIKNEDKDIVKKLISLAKKFDDLALIQPVIYNSDGSVGNTGNISNYIGIGGQAENRINNSSDFQEVQSVSGAAMFIPTKVIDKIGYLEDLYFAYHEDAEYSSRAKLVGIKTLLSTKTKIYHDHEFNKSKTKFFLLDRNKIYKLFTYYDIFSLVFLLPVIVFQEITTWGFLTIKGYPFLKLKVYEDVVKNFGEIKKVRQKISKLKTLKGFVNFINNSSGKVATKDLGGVVKLITTIINLLNQLYYYLYKMILNALFFILK